MIRFIAAAALSLFVVTPPAFGARITCIAPADRTANADNGFCGYASLETLARHLGYRQLKGLVARERKRLGPDGGGIHGPEPLSKILRRHKIPHKSSPLFRFDWDFLARACKESGAAVVGMRVGSDWSGHAVVLVGIDSRHVWLEDCNYPERDWSRMSRTEFASRWSGWTLAIDGRGTRGAKREARFAPRKQRRLESPWMK